MNMPSKDMRTMGYVLRRTNYGEADRIINIITKEGKVAVIAKGVRKTKSKLAGGIEMFTLGDYNIHFGKGELGTLTGAKMVRHYGEIMKDYGRMELAGVILKYVSAAADGADNPDYFRIVDQSLRAINRGMDLRIVEVWFWINLKRAMGEEVNLYRDDRGEKLMEGLRYDWDLSENSLVVREAGDIGVDEIKLMRLMTTVDLDSVKGIKCREAVIGTVSRIVQVMRNE